MNPLGVHSNCLRRRTGFVTELVFFDISEVVRCYFVFANSVDMVFLRQRSGGRIGCGGGEVGGGAPVEQESTLSFSFRFQIPGARKQG